MSHLTLRFCALIVPPLSKGLPKTLVRTNNVAEAVRYPEEVSGGLDLGTGVDRVKRRP
jgi:hypothetical protein